jgi:RNA polymerase sigma-70 factor (ECF subfamily)
LENQDRLRGIVEGCIRGERRSQEALFKQFYGKMMVVCLRYMTDRDTAQEVLQEAFLKVFDKLEVFDFKGSLEGWIRRIVANTAIDALRKAKRNPFLLTPFFSFPLICSFLHALYHPSILRLRAFFGDIGHLCF